MDIIKTSVMDFIVPTQKSRRGVGHLLEKVIQYKYNYIKNENGNINVADVDTELVEKIPTATQMGKVYQRLIFDTALPHESEVDGIIRVYNDPICKVIDNYNCSAYYEPSYVIARAYQNGGF